MMKTLSSLMKKKIKETKSTNVGIEDREICWKPLKLLMDSLAGVCEDSFKCRKDRKHGKKIFYQEQY